MQVQWSKPIAGKWEADVPYEKGVIKLHVAGPFQEGYRYLVSIPGHPQEFGVSPDVVSAQKDAEGYAQRLARLEATTFDARS